MTTWRFSEVHRDAKLRDPMQEAFFDDSDDLTDVLSLVRESIQNSIDARVDVSAPVVVKFTLGHFDPMSDPYVKYFDGLKEHLASARGLNMAATLDSKGTFLSIEDFNTGGLGGYTVNRMPEASEKAAANFFYFVHAEGATNKGDGKRGKWGIGKVVFPKVSKIKSFFLVSNRVRSGQTELVALGQSILKSHSIDGINFQPDGWFASYDDSEGYRELDLAESQVLMKDWKLKRGDELGLSITIPFVNETITSDSILRSVIEQYFIAIIKGDLICEIEEPSGDVKSVNADSIASLSSGIKMDDDSSTRDFSQRIALALEGHRGKLPTFTAQTVTYASLSEGIFISEADRSEIKSWFDDGTPFRVVVPVETPVANRAEMVESSFELIVVRTSGLSNSVTFAREGILVPGRRVALLRNALCLVLIEGGALADLLGLSEGPAHESWSEKAEKFREAFPKTSKAAQYIQLVRRHAVNFVKSLQVIDNELDANLLSAFFRMSKSKPSGKSPATLDGRIELEPSEEFSAISNVRGGFRIASSSQVVPVGSTISLSTGYGVLRGNPFTRWSKEDYTMENLAIDVSNASLLTAIGNRISFRVEAHTWSVSVTGFDPLRNIEIDIAEPFLDIEGETV